MLVDFVPTRDGDLNGAEANFVARLPVHAGVLALTAEEVAETTGIITAHMNSYANAKTQKAISTAATEKSRLDKHAAVKELRRIAKMIKSSKNYTTDIGKDLQIIGPESQPKNVTEIKPVLKLNITGEIVGIAFRKDSSFGINIYSRRGSETEFTRLVSNTAVDYSDSRPKLDITRPEQREYYAYFVDDNVQTGKRSAVYTAVVP